MTRWVDFNDACKIIGIHRRTLYNWIKEGMAPAYGKKDRRYIFDKASVERIGKEYNGRFKWRKVIKRYE